MGEIPQDLKTALADRYELDRELGRGGMATVYVARDVKHARDVAVKVLRPDLAASLGSERFLREIEIAAQLQHPHILMLIDSGEAGGYLYYVMPVADGGSLRDRLLREGRLDPQVAVSIVKPVANALTYAHRNGVVHRDIKPENILFSQQHPVVADFGIAKAVITAGTGRLTRTGFPIGTPGYMSPEQAAGNTDLDGLTDVYSLAAVLYEMVIGETLGMWVTDDVVELLRFTDAPPKHRSRLDRLSGSIEQALVRAMSLRREHRFATPSDFAAALDAPVDRRYRHTEAKAILRRAADLDATTPTDDGSALSLGGVARIGAEAGIPATQVRRAANALDLSVTPAPPKASRFLGAPTQLTFDRVVEGEFPESEYPLLVEQIRMTMGNVGVINTLGKSLTWHPERNALQEGRNVHVMITVRAGRTRIRVEERIGNWAGGLYGGIIGGGGGGGGTALFATLFGFAGSAAAVVGTAGWIGGMYLLARTIFTAIASKRRQELSDLTDRLAALAEDVVRE